MDYRIFLDRTGLISIAAVVGGSLLIAILLASPPRAADDSSKPAGSMEAVEKADEAKSATEKSNEYVDTAKATEDGTVHPQGLEAKPREQWFTPCPPDQKITKSGECVGMDEAGAVNVDGAQK